MEEKLTVFILVPTTKPITKSPSSMLNKIRSMIGELNCEQNDENVCALRIDYHIDEQQRTKILEECRKNNYEGMFVIAPEECEYIHPDYIEL